MLSMRRCSVIPLGIVILILAVSAVHAGDLYSGGNIIWDVGTNAGWSLTSGPPYDQVWSDGSGAIFETNGVATVTGPISLNKLVFNGPNMTITGSQLNFTGGGYISNRFWYAKDTGWENTNTISSGISGSPKVCLVRGDETAEKWNTKVMRFAPSANSTQTLGQIHFLSDIGGSKNVDVYLAGESTNNTIESMYSGPNHSYAKLFIMEGPGKWTINGDMTTGTYEYYWRVIGGTLIVNGWNQKLGLQYVQNGRLGGTGKIGGGSGGQSATVEIRSGGILSPGDGGVGTLTIDWGDTTADSTLKMLDGSILEFDVGDETNDIVHVGGDYGSSRNTLIDLDNFILRIQDAGGKPQAETPLPVFTYESDVGVDISGFDNTEANFDLSDPAVKRWGVKGLSLSNNVTDRTIYLVGLEKPPAGMVLLVH